MHKTLKEVILAVNGDVLIASDLNKIYKYTNSEIDVEGDYLYLPMVLNHQDTFSYIRKHLKKSNCRGFFISANYVKEMEFLDILRKFKPENVVIVRNIYNTGFEIAGLNANSLNPDVIIIAGNDDIDLIKNEICVNLGIRNLNYETCWQRTVDGLLRIDEKDKFVIVQIDEISSKTRTSFFANIYDFATVVFSKVSIANISTYGTIQKYCEEWSNILPKNPKNVFIQENNDFIMLPELDCIHFTDNLSKATVESFNVSYKEVSEDRKSLVINKTGALYSIKKDINRFINENKNNKKIVIFSEIPRLEEYSDNVHKEIFSSITEEIDCLVVVNMSKFIPFFREGNKKTFIRRIENLSETNLIAIKDFVEYQRDENTSILILSKDEGLCSIL